MSEGLSLKAKHHEGLIKALSSTDPKERAQAAAELTTLLRGGLTGVCWGLHDSANTRKEAQLKHSSLENTSEPLDLCSLPLFKALLSLSKELNTPEQVSGWCALLTSWSELSEVEGRALEERTRLISDSLTHPHPKVRQSAAKLLSAHSLLTPHALLERLCAEEVYFVRASLLLALGKSSPKEPAVALECLERWAQGVKGEALGSKEGVALMKARSALTAQLTAQGELTMSELSFELPQSALFWQGTQGLTEALCEELGVECVTSPQGSGLAPVSPQRSTTLSASHPLSRPRCAEGLALLMSARSPTQGEGRAARLSALLTQLEQASHPPIASAELKARLSGLSHGCRYRLNLPLNDRRAQALAHERARALMSALVPSAIESPSGYQVQLTAHYGDLDTLTLTLDALSAPTGYQRLADVGASMSMVVASAVARASRWGRRFEGVPGALSERVPGALESASAGVPGALSERVPGALESASSPEPYVIIDPTCGSGSLLIERALLDELEPPKDGRGRCYVGLDISEVALKASERNRAGLAERSPQLAARLTFEQRDSRRPEGWRAFDEALMNLPFGLRVTGERGRRADKGELDDLYFQLFRQARAHAKEGATLTCYSTQRALVERASGAMGWQVSSQRHLYAGGLKVYLWTLERRS